MDPLLNADSGMLVDSLGEEARASQDFETVPHFVAIPSVPSLISKVTGICKEHFICDCSQFADATEHTAERASQIGPHNLRQILRAKFQLCMTARRSSLSPKFWKIMLGCFFIIGLVVSTMTNRGQPTENSQQDRFARLVECAKKLDLRWNCKTRSREASIRCKALEWFLGPGANVKLDCSWDTDFCMFLSLIILRESLGIQEPSWHTTVPLQNLLEVCSWTRVHCNDAGVSGIYLNNAFLNGTIPSELLGLKTLQELWAYSSHDLVGSIPAQIGNLTNLESLELHQTSLTGTIPSELGRLSQLRTLLLHGTLVHGQMPEEVCKLRESCLEILGAKCRGKHPMVSCSCCYSCK